MKQYWQQLKARQFEDGGFPVRESGTYRADSTAWAAIALALDETAAARSAADRLGADQMEDGRVPVLDSHPQAAWVTALAVIAWSALDMPAATGRALDFLAGYNGIHPPKEPGNPGHDPSIPGWPWIADTHSWVEPTALALLAFRVAGVKSSPRIEDALRLLTDRQLPSGGWNYGNTVMFGTELRPSPDSTGVALAALSVGEASTEASIRYLEEVLPGLRTPLSIGWGVLGLSGWGRRPAGAGRWIRETLDRQARLGPFPTTEIALLLTAERCEQGLFEGLNGVNKNG